MNTILFSTLLYFIVLPIYLYIYKDRIYNRKQNFVVPVYIFAWFILIGLSSLGVIQFPSSIFSISLESIFTLLFVILTLLFTRILPRNYQAQ
jgi:hypothetical protein